MPARLRPTAPIAADAVLVGDPGRALLLAQEMLEEPKMSNHARGLWGYGGQTADGLALTIQSTGMGGPSAAIVLDDLAELGVRRAIRIGTCTALGDRHGPGDLVVIEGARAEGGSGGAFGLVAGEAALPDPALTGRLREELAGVARLATVASFDSMPHGLAKASSGATVADMQTAAVLSRCRAKEIAAGAVLIVDSAATGDRLGDDELEAVAKLAGEAAVGVLSP